MVDVEARGINRKSLIRAQFVVIPILAAIAYYLVFGTEPFADKQSLWSDYPVVLGLLLGLDVSISTTMIGWKPVKAVAAGFAVCAAGVLLTIPIDAYDDHLADERLAASEASALDALQVPSGARLVASDGDQRLWFTSQTPEELCRSLGGKPPTDFTYLSDDPIAPARCEIPLSLNKGAVVASSVLEASEAARSHGIADLRPEDRSAVRAKASAMVMGAAES